MRARTHARTRVRTHSHTHCHTHAYARMETRSRTHTYARTDTHSRTHGHTLPGKKRGRGGRREGDLHHVGEGAHDQEVLREEKRADLQPGPLPFLHCSTPTLKQSHPETVPPCIHGGGSWLPCAQPNNASATQPEESGKLGKRDTHVPACTTHASTPTPLYLTNTCPLPAWHVNLDTKSRNHQRTASREPTRSRYQALWKPSSTCTART